MSIASEIERLNLAKQNIKDSIVGKGVKVPNTATLDEYNSYIDKIQTGGGSGGGQVIEQLSSQITKLRIAPSSKGTVKLQWEIPNDPNYAGADISWAKEGVPTFPISEDNIISVDNTENTVTIEGLEEDVLYGFVVMAKNGNGTRNTASTSSNTVLGYVSKEEVFYEVSIPEDLGTSLLFNVISEMNLLFVSSMSSSNMNGCYVLRNGEWQKIIQDGYYYSCIQGHSTQGLVFLSASSYNGLSVYNVTDNICTKVSNSGTEWSSIILDDGTILASYANNLGMYKIDINTNSANKINSSFRITSKSKVVYETENYALIQGSTNASNNYQTLTRFDKSTNSLVTQASNDTSGQQQWVYFEFLEKKFICLPYSVGVNVSDILEDNTKIRTIYNGHFYLLNEDVGTCTKCTDTTSSIELAYVNNMLVYGVYNGIYSFNNDTNMFERLVEVPEGYTQLSGHWCAFDNTLFFVGRLYDGTTWYPSGLYKWNTTTNVFTLLCAKTSSVIPYGYISYVSNNKLFVQDLETSTYQSYQNCDIYVYDKTTKTAEIAYSGSNIRLFADKKDHAMLIKYSTASNGKNLVYNPQTNRFDITSTVLGSGRIDYKYDTSTENYTRELLLSNGDIIFSINGNGIKTIKFSEDGTLKKLTDDNRFYQILKSSGKEYIVNDQGVAYYYDEVTDSLVNDNTFGGFRISDNKLFNKNLNVLSIYDENAVRMYSNLQGDYSNISVSPFGSSDNKGYMYSSTSAKVLVAF